ncbi:hypothetical protein COLO4_23997 [Corchorus olitorius]|uniref:Uncharacterized protein n=1 Tax=Corchorus olitorius TaxID=93759 RepID=A0A1R3IDI1_9ROSI|nr:hypothetical protein COLO4_23997 [Corchorus olitorius]
MALELIMTICCSIRIRDSIPEEDSPLNFSRA